MSARKRLASSFKNYLTLIGLALIITVGFPYLTEFMEVPKEEIPGLTILSTIGDYVLLAGPVTLLLLLLINLWSIKHRQKQINKKVAREGVTYLMLPRPDGPSIRTDQVTLWHRLALALPYYEHICFEMSGSKEQVVFSLRTTNEVTARNILSKVIAEWPGTQVRLAKEDPLPTEAYFIEIKPMKSDQPIIASTPDPMKALLSEIAILPEGVQAGLQVLVREDPFTRLHHARKADDKTRKKPDPKISPGKKSPYSHNLSAEDRRKIRWLDERAQEAFIEVRLIVWAASDFDQLAKQTVMDLAKTVTAQYHPNNKLIKGWRSKKGNVQARQFPTFSGHPWVASEVGTIAHLVGKDALLAAPQLKVAPARPLPASTECHITEQIRAAAYLLSDKSSSDLPALIIEEDKSDLPLIIEDQDDLPTLWVSNSQKDDEDLPLIIEDQYDLPIIIKE